MSKKWICPHVFIAVENTVSNNDVFIHEYFGGVWAYIFAQPGEPAIAVSIGKNVLFVMATPVTGGK